MNILIQKLKGLIGRYVFSEYITLEARILNMTCMVGMAAALVSTLTRILMGNSIFLILVMLGIIASIAGLLYCNNRFHLYKLGTWITLITLGNILFPLAFFSLGGTSGGMAAYFTLSIVIIFLLTRGKNCIILLSIHIIWISICYYLGYFFPSWLPPLRNFKGPWIISSLF
jgi:hypothetical protein